MRTSNCFWIRKKSPRKWYANQKNPRIENFNTPKILQSPQSLEIWSSPPPASPRLFLTISSRIVDRQDDTNGETEDNDCINQKMLLKNYILQCVYTTLQSNVLIRDSYENKDPRKQPLGFMRKQKENKRQINNTSLLHCEAILKKWHSIKLQYFLGDSKFWKQWQIQR